MNRERARRWGSTQERARVAAELIEEAESLQAALPPAAAMTPEPAPPANGSGNGHGSTPRSPDTRAELAASQRDLERMLADNPNDADALTQLGVLMSRRGRWVDAAARLARAVEVDPAWAPAWYRLGEALNHLDDLAGALAAFARAADLEPHNANAFRGQGMVLDRMRRPADATAMYRRAREVAVR